MLRQQQLERERLLAEQKRQLEVLRRQQQSMAERLEISQICGNETGVPLLRSAGNRFQYRFRFPERSLSVPWIFEFA